ncbi:disulfide isomerase-like 1-2 [Chlorella sorokiniana]|jgi:protein disulfide-isomerase A1|uniref:Protein disulfide-isomerase n=1 Tax=Chlorella sorokiniana TaxID=3076 RepID=A0A2P6TZC6_CHLSO|nr:disulfide isomerase-like 1-2 [Chlorella sorokiniana]|eukprot:PRW59419.1 disulfide isomerase-like 1-2 [Chlorella sorokiniana]
MARIAIALLLVLACAWRPAAAAEDVVTISGLSQLEELVKKHPFVVAEFYAPWCGHCKRLEPEWAKAATTLKGHDPEIVLAKVDATAKENEEAKSKFKIGGFPTIKIFRGDLNKPAPYEGPRDEPGIVKYLKKQVLPAYVKLESAKAIKAARDDAEVLVLAYLEDEKGEEFKTFTQVAEALRNDIDFAYVTDHKLVEECKTDCKSPFVIMFKAGESEQPRYEGKFETALLRTWASAKSLPLVIKFGSQSGNKHLQKAFSANSPRLIAVAKAESADLMEQLQQASKANDDLAVILAEETTGKRLIDYYGIKLEGKKLVLMIEDPKISAKYMKGDAKASDIPEFLREFKEGALERWLKSEEPPADNKGPVRVLTGKTFEEEVFKGGKDTFIKFYAPWCGHCKKLAPTWEELGAEFTHDSNVVVAKLDATTNDIPSPKISVRGYPTLVFVTAKGDVISYSGDRTKEALLEFVGQKRTTKPGKPAEEEEEEEEEETAAEKAAADKAERESTDKAKEKKEAEHEEL